MSDFANHQEFHKLILLRNCSCMQPSLSKLAACSLLLIAMTINSGCGRSDPHQVPQAAVSGTVTFDGKPLSEGTIYFKDISKGQADEVQIQNGQYAGKASIGSRRVEIYAWRTLVTNEGGMKTETRLNDMPAKYNKSSELNVEVSASNTNKFDFDTSSKK